MEEKLKRPKHLINITVDNLLEITEYYLDKFEEDPDKFTRDEQVTICGQMSKFLDIVDEIAGVNDDLRRSRLSKMCERATKFMNQTKRKKLNAKRT